MSSSKFKLLFLMASLLAPALCAQSTVPTSQAADTTKPKLTTSQVAPAASDSSTQRLLQLETNRKRAAALDDSIARCKGLRPLLMLGMVAGGAITVFGLVDAQQKAQEKARNKSMSSGKSETAVELNLVGLFVGIPMMAICAYGYVNQGTKISGFEWQKSKLKLSMSETGTNLAYSYQTSF